MIGRGQTENLKTRAGQLFDDLIFGEIVPFEAAPGGLGVAATAEGGGDRMDVDGTFGAKRHFKPAGGEFNDEEHDFGPTDLFEGVDEAIQLLEGDAVTLEIGGPEGRVEDPPLPRRLEAGEHLAEGPGPLRGRGLVEVSVERLRVDPRLAEDPRRPERLGGRVREAEPAGGATARCSDG